MYDKTVLGRNFFLARLDCGVIKLFQMATLQTNNMVMVFAEIQFENGFPAFEIVALQNARQFKLGQHTVNRGEAHVFAAGKQLFVYILGA